MKERDALEHRDPPKALGRVLERVLHILHDGLLADGLLDAPLRLDVERVRIEMLDLALPLELGAHVPVARLSQELGEPCGVILGGVCELGLCLRINHYFKDQKGRKKYALLATAA